MKLRATLFEGAKRLRDAGIKSSDYEALEIMMYILGIDKVSIYQSLEEEISNATKQRFDQCISKRATRYPLSYILGYVDFYGIRLSIDEGVLVPRPDSEVLVEEVLSFIKGHRLSKPEVVDICAGSGALGIAIALNSDANVTLIDLYDTPLKLCKANVERLGLGERVKVLRSDLLGEYEGLADIIISNPPYIESLEIDSLMLEVSKYEPRSALDGGWDGLYFYRTITDQARDKLKAGGLLIYEIGSTQANPVKDIMKEYNTSLRYDYSGLPRVLGGIRIEN